MVDSVVLSMVLLIIFCYFIDLGGGLFILFRPSERKLAIKKSAYRQQRADDGITSCLMQLNQLKMWFLMTSNVAYTEFATLWRGLDQLPLELVALTVYCQLLLRYNDQLQRVYSAALIVRAAVPALSIAIMENDFSSRLNGIINSNPAVWVSNWSIYRRIFTASRSPVLPWHWFHSDERIFQLFLSIGLHFFSFLTLFHWKKLKQTSNFV